jgi:hypothetical protein
MLIREQFKKYLLQEGWNVSFYYNNCKNITIENLKKLFPKAKVDIFMPEEYNDFHIEIATPQERQEGYSGGIDVYIPIDGNMIQVSDLDFVRGARIRLVFTIYILLLFGCKVKYPQKERLNKEDEKAYEKREVLTKVIKKYMPHAGHKLDEKVLNKVYDIIYEK